MLLVNLTDQGIRNIKETPQRIEEVHRGVEAAGGRVLAFYAVMGPYDYVAVVEGPSDEVALAQLLALGMAGNARTVILRAFTREEFAAVVGKLP